MNGETQPICPFCGNAIANGDSKSPSPATPDSPPPAPPLPLRARAKRFAECLFRTPGINSEQETPWVELVTNAIVNEFWAEQPQASERPVTEEMVRQCFNRYSEHFGELHISRMAKYLNEALAQPPQQPASKER